MTAKNKHWNGDQALPKFADRETCAAIVSHYFFPIKPRTIATWPLVARRPNRNVVYDVNEVLEFAKYKFNQSPTYKQG
tara:strand:+ start:461 stop:694 length:234 start_codon:yes stop_codon:yes gene_type:complete